MDIRGKIAVVTGGNRGMGRAVCRDTFDLPVAPCWLQLGNFLGWSGIMTSIRIVTPALAAVLVATPAIAQGSKAAIGISGWTGFAPIVFAKETDIFSKNGLDVS